MSAVKHPGMKLHAEGCEFTVLCLDESHEKVVREWLDYGALRGIGQWRNSGKGRFEWEEIK